MEAENVSTITLSDDRCLAYIEEGKPDGGPVLFFHGTPGSRRFRHPNGAVAPRLDARVIHVDRPGYGRSDPQPGRTLLDWSNDVVALAAALGLDRFCVAGISGGAPYALAAAWALPERIPRVALISGMAPLDAPGGTNAMILLNRVGFWIARRIPFLLPLALAPMARGVRKNPRGALEEVAAIYSEPDKRVMERHEIRDMLIDDMSEAYRQGTRGHADDLRSIAGPWGFPLEEIQPPVRLWQGEQDRNVPPGMAQHMATQIPKAELTRLPREGHLLMFKHWGEILAWLLDR